MNQEYYETTAFFLHHNYISSCPDKDGYSHRLFFPRQFYLLENVVNLSTKPTGFFDIRAHIEYWRL